MTKTPEFTLYLLLNDRNIKEYSYFAQLIDQNQNPDQAGFRLNASITPSNHPCQTTKLLL